MNNVHELHEAALELIDKAALSVNTDESRNLLIQAFELERDAAMELSEVIDISTIRSMLFYEAIKLAFRLGKFKDANDLATIAQKGLVHEDFADLIENQRIRSEHVLAV